jgi:phosphonate transport system substrate-binding protein
MPTWLKLCFVVFAVALAAYALLFFPRPPQESTSAPPRPVPGGSPAEGVRTYTFATVDMEALHEELRATPLMRYFNERLRSHALQLQVKVFGSTAEVHRAFRAGSIDLYYDSAAIAYLLSEKYGFTARLVRHYEGVGSYHGVIFVRADSPILRLEGLRGRRFAAESPASTSAFFLPLDLMARAGLSFASSGALGGSLDPGSVNVILSEQESVSLMWVLDGRVDAGAMKNTRFDDLDASILQQLRVLARTAEVPREVVAFSGAMDPADEERILEVFLAAAETEAGRDALEVFQHTTVFRPLAEPASHRAFFEELTGRALPFRSE